MVQASQETYKYREQQIRQQQQLLRREEERRWRLMAEISTPDLQAKDSDLKKLKETLEDIKRKISV